MAVTSGSVSCPSNAAAVIVAAANSHANAAGSQKGGRTVVLTNLSGNTCYIGGADVTSAGYRLLTGASVSLTIGQSDVLYGLSAVNSALIGYIATG